MSFAERHGFIQAKAIQVDDMDSCLRNRLYNAVHKYMESSGNIHTELEYVVDKLGYKQSDFDERNWDIIDALLLRNYKSIPWYMPYEVIECFFEAKRAFCKECRDVSCAWGGPCGNYDWLRDIPKKINTILEEEKSGYRMLNDKFVKIIDENELNTISKATQSPFHSVSTHIQKALTLYADRQNPDHENSIKESISAVEAMCCIITGMTGASATLGAALKKLEDKGVVIHGAMRAAFSQLYGYASDEDGIRHGGIDFKNAPAEDAKYMLISCSAFVNYLIEKYSKIGGTN